MAKHDGIFSKLLSKIRGVRIPVEDLMGYDIVRDYSTLSDLDFITKGQANQIFQPAGGGSKVYINFTNTFTSNWKTGFVPGSTTLTWVSVFGDVLPDVTGYSNDPTEGFDINTVQLHFDPRDGNGNLGNFTCNQPGTWLLILS